ncbi:hypothetical protein CGZ94_20925 [Enemella evansiae]|uniref:Uncharacterized protein n=1 Tax=Enemella evansiae TaxID=2016499 RepID=A0A255FW81_9ACTN|nr:hypothetical protein [Enemella evansiae]OYO07925.1 hypothetical protein CGZ94_20925 [Enemella evansiae]OYO14952.1 hypothetical protein CGZ98_00385 [Enemella evansiae]
MTRIVLLRALLPASLGLAMLQATLGWPLTSQTSGIVRVVGFLVWFAAVLAAILLSQRAPDPRRARTRDWVLVVVALVLLLGGVFTLGALGAPEQALVAIGVVLLGVLVWRLGESWISSAAANAGILALGCGLSGLLLAFSPLRGWTGLIAGVAGGGVLLIQGLWSALRTRVSP